MNSLALESRKDHQRRQKKEVVEQGCMLSLCQIELKKLNDLMHEYSLPLAEELIRLVSYEALAASMSF